MRNGKFWTDLNFSAPWVLKSPPARSSGGCEGVARRLSRAEIIVRERVGCFLAGRSEDVGRAAGRKWHNHAHGSFGVGLHPGEARQRLQRGSARYQTQNVRSRPST